MKTAVAETEKLNLRTLIIPLNRCSLPGHVIASLAYQRAPIEMELDGILPHFADLFTRLRKYENDKERAECFVNYMAVRFRLPGHDLVPWPEAEPVPRPSANYRRLLLGWLFDSDSDAGAVWRWWVESRFGLRTLYHKEPIHHFDDPAYMRFMQACGRGLYNTNDLETQLDLLYYFCQSELAHRHPNQTHLSLYRGVNGQETLYRSGDTPVICFNNLSSFTHDLEEAFRFGSKVYSVLVPLNKIVCFDTLLPGSLKGESEYMVLGGLYEVSEYVGV